MNEEPALFALIRAGNLKAVSMYLEQYPSNRPLPQHGNTTALMLCVESMYDAAGSWHQQAVQGQNNVQQGDQEIEDRVRLLTRVSQRSSSYFFDRNSHGQTVLHLAAAAGCKGAQVVSSILAVVSEAVLECLLPEDSYEDDDNDEENVIVSKAFWIRCRSKWTALHTAVVHQNYKAATLLLKHMVKNRARDYRDYCVLTEDMVPQTLLSLALENNASRKFLRLIVHKFPEAASISDVYDKLPLAAAIEQKLSSRKLQIILQTYPDATRIANRHGDLPLHLAAMYYQREPVELQCQILQILLELHPRAICTSNIHGQWPLHCAMEPDTRDNNDDGDDDDESSTERPPTILDLAVLQLLSNHRVDNFETDENAAQLPIVEQPRSSGVVENSDDSFTHLAIGYSTESSLDDASFAMSHDKMTALREESHDDYFPNKENLESCSALLHADCYGELPLHVACRRIDRITPVALQWLLEMYPKAARTVNKYGHLPLHLAAATTETTNNLTNLRTLLNAYANAVWQADYEGDVPLLCAVGNLHVPAGVVECLLIEPAMVLDDDTHPTKNPSTGQLPLHCSCASGTASKYLDLLLAYHPAALFHYDFNGYLPFHIAISKPGSQVMTVKKLLFAAARLWTTRASVSNCIHSTEALPCTADGTPALFVACEATGTSDGASNHATESLDIIRFLVERSPELFNPFKFAKSPPESRPI